jgi:hypothetical protein
LSEEIEFRLERSVDRTESLGGVEYEALFQMMAAAAQVIEVRLGKSPFSDPEAAGSARYAWREIIYSLTPDPNEIEIVKEQRRLIDEISDLKPPQLPELIEYSGIERDKQLARYQNEFRKQLSDIVQKMNEYSKQLRKLGEVGKEAFHDALSLPKHR